jgi:anti-sigma-K factor RskA
VTTSHDSRHHHADELLEDYLLGTLSADDAAWVEAHIESCPECQAEMGPLIRAVQALPFGAPEPDVAMSDQVWSRIERTVSTSVASTSDRDVFVPLPDVPPANASGLRSIVPSTARPGGLHGRQWMLVAALMAVSLLVGALLGVAVPRLGEDDPDADRIAIQFTDPSITATGELRYLPDEQVFVLEISGMPEPPEGYVYQAWLINDDAPVPVGVMNTKTGEFASAGDRDAFQTFAITVEAGPLGNDAPTSDPILVAPLHERDTEES